MINNSKSNVRFGLMALSVVAFIAMAVLKLTLYPDLPWFWMLFPLWAGIAAVVVVVALLAMGTGLWIVARTAWEQIRGEKQAKKDFKKSQT
jgi:hypothetical protein